MNKVFKEIRSILTIIAVIFIFRSSILNWYVIPTGSLMPTLKVGDHVVVNKLSYGIMLPLMQTRIFSWDQPKRGDIVVFEGPETEKKITLIKRVVGVGGDRVKFTNGILTVNGILAKQELQADRSILERLGGNENPDNLNLYIESGFSKYPHFILKKKWGGITDSQTQTWVVPEGKLLLVGDNRDNSEDGRFWGFVDEKNIYGRAFAISYSTYDKPGSFLPEFRNDRWFKEITN
ncbi:signal peptidase I [Fluviispira sanaruensis]|uniref:Signal peptidase I n=1 Tax=Fluviispira sanaruensis TaxID=2493639 RepID=A0A4P2VMU1_FLUSA|nr:signal peptidase I [Fluviispira sanaruensis]BBH54311.1 signal peptidase I [Fluviispira sanaruensis]